MHGLLTDQQFKQKSQKNQRDIPEDFQEVELEPKFLRHVFRISMVADIDIRRIIDGKTYTNLTKNTPT